MERCMVWLALLAFVSSLAMAQIPKTISYQGVLTDLEGNPVADGTYSLTFRLYEEAEGGTAVWEETHASVTVTDGVFGVLLGSVTPLELTFDQPYWLGLAVNGEAELMPRVALAAVPYSFMAAQVDSGVAVRSLNGLRDAVELVAGANVAIEVKGQQIRIAAVGGGNGGGTSEAWSLTGNAGTTPGTHFLGTTDAVPLEVRVNSQRALRLEPGSSPNVVGGHADNRTVGGVVGAAIGGGGAPDDAAGDPEYNAVTDDYGTIGGGWGNQAGDNAGTTSDQRFATVGGGKGNNASRVAATVAGGNANQATGNYASVGGGRENIAANRYATVGGGWNNQVLADYGTIVGGGPSNPDNVANTSNRVFDNYGTIGGGGNNRAGSDDGNATSATFATVGGGSSNTASNRGATVGGGSGNRASGIDATVGGGFDNRASEGYATVAGGKNNRATHLHTTVSGGVGNTASDVGATVGGGSNNTAGGSGATVGGGDDNTASGSGATVAGGNTNQATGDYATVGGGSDNTANSGYATVGGGAENVASNGMATVSGGWRNTASGNRATVGGGESNTASGAHATVGGGLTGKASGEYATVGGGVSNFATGRGATVPGGSNNTAAGAYSFAAGRRARANHDGTFVWSDYGANIDFASTAANQFLVRAIGGVGFGTNAPQASIHVRGSRNGSATLSNHVAIIENGSFSTTNGPDVLALKTSALNPGGNTNFITFFNGNDQAIGRIEGNGSGGILYASTGADYAEALPLLSPGEAVEAGDIVGVVAGRVTRQTSGTHRMMVVTDRPAVLGNMPPEGQEEGYVPIAFVGQVRVKVWGPVRAGDYILPSGREDGTGVAVAPETLAAEDVARIVGQAWEDVPGTGLHRVNVLVGLDRRDVLIARQQAELERLAAEVARLQAMVESLLRQASSANATH